MKNYLLILILVSFISCKKGTDYCETPPEINALLVKTQNNAPTAEVEVWLDFIPDYSKYQLDNLYSFSTPDVFINPKGDRPGDVSKNAVYKYKLKDTLNPPASVKIQGYAFNDCGKSNIVEAIITYDTTGI